MLPAVLVAVLLIVLAVREFAARRRERRLHEEIDALRGQLKESDRLVNVGQLVSGLAQDLKSPLQGMLGSAELLAASEPADADAAQELIQIRENVTRAAGIVRNLLAFTETTQLDRRWDDLNEIVRRAIQHHRSGGASPDGVSFQGTSRLQLVYVDGRQIEKVITTLLALTHAAHARGGGGAGYVTVTTHRMTSPGDHMTIDVDDPRPVADADEVGWSSDLDACRRVLQAHGGSLEVEYRGAAGIRFHMELPVTELVETEPT